MMRLIMEVRECGVRPLKAVLDVREIEKVCKE